MKSLMLSTILLTLSAAAIAGVPSTMTHQAVLTDNLGVPVADGDYSLTFRLYDAVSGGNLLWEETQLVPVSGGVFTALLGQTTPLGLPFDQPYWIALSVNGGTELAPRTPLTTAPYSFGTRAIPDSVVTPAKVMDGTVVRSINGLVDDLYVRAEGGASLSVAGDTLVINAGAGGPSNTPWNLNGSDIFYTNGRVGMGTAAPETDVHIGDNQSFLIGAATTGSGSKVLWLAGSAAFRAGALQPATSTFWDPDSVGSHSFAAGRNTRATGFAATAIGGDTEARGSHSFAANSHTRAHNYFSVAMGSQTDARGIASTALGNHTRADAFSSTAVGYFNVGGGNPSSWIDDDPVFEVGVGSSALNPQNALTVLKNGNVGIGTSFPLSPLQVDGDVTVNGASTASFFLAFDGYSFVRPTADNSQALGTATRRFTDVWATNGTIQTSDIREKEAVEDCVYGLDEVLRLRPVHFQWKAHPERGRKLGLIAQDLLPVVPEAVKTFAYEPVQPGPDTDPTVEPETRRVKLDRLGVNYSDLIPVLIKAIQEQQATIKAMQARIDRLEAR